MVRRKAHGRMHLHGRQQAEWVPASGVGAGKWSGCRQVEFMARPLPPCHGRPWAGHPRLTVLEGAKSWVAGPSPAMTHECCRLAHECCRLTHEHCRLTHESCRLTGARYRLAGARCRLTPTLMEGIPATASPRP